MSDAKSPSVNGAAKTTPAPARGQLLESGRTVQSKDDRGTATAPRVSDFRKRLNPKRENAKSFVELGVDAFQTVVGYARQQILDPMKSLGKYLGLGMAGAVVCAIGLILFLYGLLRLLQTETSGLFGGAVTGGRWLSFAPYLIVIIVGAAILGFVFSRISKDKARKQVR